jgi:hypothetical protein
MGRDLLEPGKPAPTDVRAFLDAELVKECGGRVLRSIIVVGFSPGFLISKREGQDPKYERSAQVTAEEGWYYAAVENANKLRVEAMTCFFSFKPVADSQFSWKWVHEHEGPAGADCPPAILDLLTPLPDGPMFDDAREWRRDCRRGGDDDDGRDPQPEPDAPPPQPSELERT